MASNVSSVTEKWLSFLHKQPNDRWRHDLLYGVITRRPEFHFKPAPVNLFILFENFDSKLQQQQKISSQSWSTQNPLDRDVCLEYTLHLL